ncbi:raffinose/stachyose/melibiose transport system permease protein [Orenia metallireducens]|uniref:Raffinose/stachyose/melibiose transport system permease protein n=1 Tax=Orenia metallireducens TaxID=1413210 RepID=A0A285I7S2_9FIRM|nr:carbohydrate ABC transporter permease [Orenia metallireducens]PRX22385.1 raffinose/stachyose/melibiose transport system permease protein [Orenia metallireducens]SNY44018.1 raffinose/stachyose/melibiose transport system permease protein [Orenia metallireducens]
MNKGNKVILRIIGILTGLLFLSPFYIVVINAFKTKKELFMDTLGLPNSFSFDNFVEAWKRLDFLSVFFNSLIITVGSIVFIIIFSSMAAWMLQRTKSKLSNLIFFGYIAAMLIPFQAVMLPLVRVMGNLNLLNIPGLMFMYVGFGSSLSIFLYHGFVKGIPTALDEAATIDGCNSWQTFWHIIFPILKPITITVAILNTVWIWNDFLLPSLVINRPGTRTIPLATFFFFGEYTKQWHLALAGLGLAIIPVIIFYFFAQKHIIESVTAGSVK